MKSVDITSITAVNIKSPRARKMFFWYQARVEAQRQKLQQTAREHGSDSREYLREEKTLASVRTETRKFLDSIGKPHITV